MYNVKFSSNREDVKCVEVGRCSDFESAWGIVESDVFWRAFRAPHAFVYVDREKGHAYFSVGRDEYSYQIVEVKENTL